MRCIAPLLLVTTILTGCASSHVPMKPVSKLSPEVSQGTGFLVRSDGLVLTAFHVVEGGNTIKVRCQGHDLVTAKLGERSQHLDLAVLHTPLTGTPYLPVADPRSARAGEESRLCSVAGTEEGLPPSVDESGQDYLYPSSYFVSIAVPETARRALTHTR